MEDTDSVQRTAPVDDDLMYTQRLPRWIVKKLDAEAEREHRSRTGQVIRILEERYASEKMADQSAAT